MIENLIENSKVSAKPKRLKTLPDNCIVADIETTGLNPTTENIIEISALKVVDNKVVEEFSSLVKPNKKIPYFITKLTGITNEMVESAETIETVLKKFMEFIDDKPIVGHNVRFDLSFLNKNSKDYFQKEIENQYSDTLFFARKVFKELPSCKLTAIAEYLNIDTKNAHRALKDCYMTYQIMQEMKSRTEKAPD